MKFNVKFNVEKATKEFKEKFERLKRDEQWKNAAATLAIRKIQGETRLGTFIQSKKDQKRLKDSTIEKRKYLAKYNTPGISFGPKKSNLTMTGQLLASLQRVPDATTVIIEAVTPRLPYMGKDGKPIVKKTPTNQELVGYLKKMGRRFLGYDLKLKEQIKKALKEHVRRFLLR